MTAEEIVKFDKVFRYIAARAVCRGYVDRNDEARQRAYLCGLQSSPDMSRSPREINRWLQQRLIGSFLDDSRKHFREWIPQTSLEEYEETQSREAFNYESYLAKKRETEALEEMRDVIERATRQFSSRDKNVFCMYYYDGLKASEIGEVVGLSESRVSQLLKGMRERIKTFARREMKCSNG
jgi:RNA polymerase sigma factor (sigma-70 family)